MMRNIFLGPIAAFAVLTIACGGGPTAPTPLAAQNGSTVATPASPAPPAPAPTPAPAPAPDPAPPAQPAPVPAPDAGTKFAAHVDTVHWYTEPLFDSTFELTRFSDRIVFGTVTLPIVYQDDRGFIARDSQMTFSVVGSSWTFNGIAGTGSGTLSR